MARVQRYPEETPITDLERRIATLEGIIRQRFLEGEGQIDSGSTTAVITHGLGVVPSSVFVTPKGNTLIWIGTITSTTFNVLRTGTSGNLTFSWLAVP